MQAINNQQQNKNNTIVGIIGSGAMGIGISQVAASAGFQVILFDNNLSTLNLAKENLNSTLKKLVEKNKITALFAKEIINNIKFAREITEFNNCNLIIEAVIENLDVKQKLFSELELIVPLNCIIASNTSSFSITSIASACKSPERVIGIHFFNPAPLMPLVEIIPAITTKNEITTAAKNIIDLWGKVTVLVKDTPGFIVNRLARSFYGEAIRIYEEGIADFATIDWSMKTLGAFKMGPFELMDFIGNDINYKVTESVWTQFFYEPRFKPSLTQKRMFEANWFGRKTGRGYYNYAQGHVQPSPIIDEKLNTYIFDRIIAMLVNEAIDSFYLQLASKEDLDLAMMKGVNYPKGLLKWADDLGLQNVLDTLNNLYQLYNEDRYRPSVLLKTMVQNKKTFY